MAQLKCPSSPPSEGGSGGALAISGRRSGRDAAVLDLPVISPEGCASTDPLENLSDKAETAAEASSQPTDSKHWAWIDKIKLMSRWCPS
jgi:acetyl-CoA carboxylase alpha subunit